MFCFGSASGGSRVSSGGGSFHRRRSGDSSFLSAAGGDHCWLLFAAAVMLFRTSSIFCEMPVTCDFSSSTSACIDSIVRVRLFIVCRSLIICFRKKFCSEKLNRI